MKKIMILRITLLFLSFGVCKSQTLKLYLSGNDCVNCNIMFNSIQNATLKVKLEAYTISANASFYKEMLGESADYNYNILASNNERMLKPSTITYTDINGKVLADVDLKNFEKILTVINLDTRFNSTKLLYDSLNLNTRSLFLSNGTSNYFYDYLRSKIYNIGNGKLQEINTDVKMLLKSIDEQEYQNFIRYEAILKSSKLDKLNLACFNFNGDTLFAAASLKSCSLKVKGKDSTIYISSYTFFIKIFNNGNTLQVLKFPNSFRTKYAPNNLAQLQFRDNKLIIPIEAKYNLGKRLYFFNFYTNKITTVPLHKWWKGRVDNYLLSFSTSNGIIYTQNSLLLINKEFSPLPLVDSNTYIMAVKYEGKDHYYLAYANSKTKVFFVRDFNYKTNSHIDKQINLPQLEGSYSVSFVGKKLILYDTVAQKVYAIE